MSYEYIMLSELVKKFCDDFLNELNSIMMTLDKLHFKNIKSMLPCPFNHKNSIEILAYYSIDKKQLFIVFNKGNKNKFSFLPVYGNPIPLNVFNFKAKEDDTKISSISGLSLQGNGSTFAIDYSFITTLTGFFYGLHNIEEFTINFINSYRDFYEYKDKKSRQDYFVYLEKLKENMRFLFFNEDVPELEIDKFLQDNPVILNRGLNLEKLNHQIILKNILNKYEHDLKPDLIAYDICNKKWVIVDYKRAKRSIMKNEDKVRTGFRADVHGLKDQLNDYIEYFDEKEHRDYVKRTYRLDINFPQAIGIIGRIDNHQEIAFNRLLENEPRWFNVVPYNYLYDNFCRYVETIKKIEI